MAVSRRVLARTIVDQIEAGDPIDRIAPRLAAYMVENHLEKHADEIVSEIKYQLERRGIVNATVITARPLTDDLRALAKKYIKQKSSATSIKLDEVVDESIIGGIIIEMPTSRYDASVAQAVRQLKVS